MSDSMQVRQVERAAGTSAAVEAVERLSVVIRPYGFLRDCMHLRFPLRFPTLVPRRFVERLLSSSRVLRHEDHA